MRLPSRNLLPGFLLIFLFCQAIARGQSLYDVMASLSDRDRVVQQQGQMYAHLSGQSVTADTPLSWAYVSPGFGETDVESLSWDKKIELLNSAIVNFERLAPGYINASSAEFVAGGEVGALLPFSPDDFEPLPRVTLENYHAVLRLLAQRVRALQFIQWPVKFKMKRLEDRTYVYEAWVDNEVGGEKEVRDLYDGDNVVSSPVWTPGSIGTGNLHHQVSDLTDKAKFVLACSPSQLNGYYFSDDDGLQTQDIYFALEYPESVAPLDVIPPVTGVQVSAQVSGSVYVLRRSYHNGFTVTTPPERFKAEEAGWFVEGSGSSGNIPLFNSTPGFKVTGSWPGDASNGKAFLPDGYKHAGADWGKTYETNWKIGCDFCGIFKPAFSHGLDATGVQAKLDSAETVLADHGASGELLLNPRPGMLYGVRLGPALKCGAEAFLSTKPMQPLVGPIWSLGLPQPLIRRFDSSYGLRVAGSLSGYHVVFDNTRAGRTQELDSDSGFGWPKSESVYDVETLFKAWDSPRLVQVVGRDLVADIQYSDSHYGGYTIGIYRRAPGAATPAPGAKESLTGLVKIREWTFSDPGAGAAGTLHPTSAEELVAEATGGTGNEKFEIKATHVLPKNGWGEETENEYGENSNWWWWKAGTWGWSLKLSDKGSSASSEQWRKEIAIETTVDSSFVPAHAVSVREFTGGTATTELTSATLNPFGEFYPQDWTLKLVALDNRTITGTPGFGTPGLGDREGRFPSSLTVDYHGLQPNLTCAWQGAGGTLSSFSQGPWTASGSVDSTKGGAYKLERKFNGSVFGRKWIDLTDKSKVTVISAPDGVTENAGQCLKSEITYGTDSTGLPGLIHSVVNGSGSGSGVKTGSTYEWNVGTTGSYTCTLKQGLLSGTSVSRGIRTVSTVNPAGYPTQVETFAFKSGSEVKTSGTSFDDPTLWGAPKRGTDSTTGYASTWSYDGGLPRLSSFTGALGAASTFGGYDVLGRPTQSSVNGINATTTYAAFSTSTAISDTAEGLSGTASESWDGAGRPTASSSSWAGTTSGTSFTQGDDTLGITSTSSLYGAHQATVRKADGSVAGASGATLPFSGTAEDGLAVSNGLLVSRTELKDEHGDPSGAYQTVYTDAWGRVRKVESPALSGTGMATTVTSYSDPGAAVQQVITVDPAGRVFITESELSTGTERSGIDLNASNTLTDADRCVETVTDIAGTAITRVTKIAEDTGFRTILATSSTPSSGVSSSTVNGEETVNSTPDFPHKKVTTESPTKGWSRTVSVNELGLPVSEDTSGPGIPALKMTPSWRRDGSISGVTLKVGAVNNAGGEDYSATINPDGTLSELMLPGHAHNRLTGDGHTLAGGVESVEVDGVKTVTRLDGTRTEVSGTGVIAKTDELTATNGFQEIVSSGTAGITTTELNAAGAATAKRYADNSQETYGYEGGLPKTVNLLRGGQAVLGYSGGAKDLTGISWPAMSGDHFAVPAFAEAFSYDRSGLVKGLGDASGLRSLGYLRGRLESTNWTAGALRGYQVERGIDATGRGTGFTLRRDGAVIHSASRGYTGVSDQVAGLASGALKVLPQRDAQGRLTGYQWGSATGTFIPRVTQTWSRGAGGRIEAAQSNVTGAPSFDYFIDGQPLATSFDNRDRHLKCKTAGRTWTYEYDSSGQLSKATRDDTTPLVIDYGFDGVGRRSDKGAGNLGDLLNRTVAWNNSQAKTLRIDADPAAQVSVNGTAITGFTGSYTLPLASPGPQGGWVPWTTLAVLPGQGEGAGTTPVNPLASPDAKAQKSGATWIPPVNETFHYDAAGNRLDSAQWEYGWDAKDQLVRARTKDWQTAPQGWDLRFAYDSEGRRFRKEVTRYAAGAVVEQKTVTYVWDGWDIVYERQQLSSGLTILERKYLWGEGLTGSGREMNPGGLLLIRESKGDSSVDLIPLYDGTGHVVALSSIKNDGTAELQASYAYGPFGEPMGASGPRAAGNPWRYATKYLDEETGLYYFGHRYYDPVTGQWLNREPLGESESINLYSYCHNDPVNKVDVLGLQSEYTKRSLEIQKNPNRSFGDSMLAAWYGIVGSPCDAAVGLWGAFRTGIPQGFARTAQEYKEAEARGTGDPVQIALGRTAIFAGQTLYGLPSLIANADRVPDGIAALPGKIATDITEFPLASPVSGTLDLFEDGLVVYGGAQIVRAGVPALSRLTVDGLARGGRGLVTVGSDVRLASGRLLGPISEALVPTYRGQRRLQPGMVINPFGGGKVPPKEFEIVRYGDKAAGFQNHHGVMDKWASENISGYVSRASDGPSMRLSLAGHEKTNVVYRAFSVEQAGKPVGARIDWKGISPETAQELTQRMFDAAGVPSGAREAYFRAFNNYIHVGHW